MEDAPSDPWAEEALAPRLAAAVEEHLPALAAGLSPEEAQELKPLCLRAFEYLVMEGGGDDPGVGFREIIPGAVREAAARGVEGLRQVLADHRLMVQLGSLSAWIHPLAKRAAQGGLTLTPEQRQEVQEKRRELTDLLKTLRSGHAHLEDSRLPRPALVVYRPAMVNRWVSGAILDFRYVQDSSGGSVMSIELAHEVGLLPSRPGKTAPPPPDSHNAGPT